MERHGGQILVKQLNALKVRRVFSVPGESFLAALDGLYDSGIENIVCRQEGGAAMMAEAYGKMTGTPGVCFVTRGPGATNASAGIHIAHQDSTPMVMFVGQIARDHQDREAFQEVDYQAMFGGLAKWVGEVREAERLPEYIRRAFHVAMSGRPGPVVLSLPEDMLSARVACPPSHPIGAESLPDLSAVANDAVAWLSSAQKPLVIVGGPLWTQQAHDDLADFAQRQNIPVAAGFRRQDYMDNRHPNYVGDLNVGINPKLAERVKNADALMVIGSRLGDIETKGYTLVDPCAPHARIFHVHSESNEIGRVYPAEKYVTASSAEFLSALAAVPSGGGDWADWTAAARRDYEDWVTPRPGVGDLTMEHVVKTLSDTLPKDAILTNGAGNYAAWLHRYFVYKQHGTQLAPTSGSMGYGFPAAVSASLEYPDKTVVCFAGDGCFQMTLNEMSTAIQHGSKPIVIVANNGRYGTIRMHQERTYPNRISGTMLANPDFAALARAYGGHGELVERDEDFAAAFERARAAQTLAVIELKLDQDALSPSLTLSGVQQGQ